MGDSNNFSSLQDLVNHHLSQMKLQENESDDTDYCVLGGIKKRLRHIATASQSDSNVASTSKQVLIGGETFDQILARKFSKFMQPENENEEKGHMSGNENSGSESVNAGHSSDVILNKDTKEQALDISKDEKSNKGSENPINEENDDYVIDLSDAIIIKPYARPVEVPQEKTDLNSSTESLFELPIEFNDTPAPVELFLEYNLDHINKKMRAKPSEFGRVVSMRYKTPLPLRSFKEIVITDIEPFDFSTKSPSDIYLENKRRPTMHIPATKINLSSIHI